MTVALEYSGLRYTTHPDVYAPHDDTWLLVDAVRALGDLSGQCVVEVGCGAGLGMLAAARAGALAVGTDRNQMALQLATRNAARNGLQGRTRFVLTDLLAGLSLHRVDHVLFNAPYLPTAPEERVAGDLNFAFDGGLSGNDTLFQFADGFARRGGARPTITMITSSLNDRSGIGARLERAGYGAGVIVDEKALPYERLFVERFAPR